MSYVLVITRQTTMRVVFVALGLLWATSISGLAVPFRDCLTSDTDGLGGYFTPTSVIASYQTIPGTSERSLQFQITGNVTGELIDVDEQSNHYSKYQAMYSEFCCYFVVSSSSVVEGFPLPLFFFMFFFLYFFNRLLELGCFVEIEGPKRSEPSRGSAGFPRIKTQTKAPSKASPGGLGAFLMNGIHLILRTSVTLFIPHFARIILT